MPVVRLVCWKEDLARERARVVKEAGIPVDASPLKPGRLIGHFRANPAAAVLIDLDRLPSHGREVAVALRSSKSTRHIPIVFAGGPEEKVARIRHELPDAFFTDWTKVVGVLQKALKSSLAEPVQPIPHMARYAGSSLVKKLGFTPKTKAALIGAPEGFAETLGEMPDGVELQNKMTSRTTLALWFVRFPPGTRARDGVSQRAVAGGRLALDHPPQANGPIQSGLQSERCSGGWSGIRSCGLQGLCC